MKTELLMMTIKCECLTSFLWIRSLVRAYIYHFISSYNLVRWNSLWWMMLWSNVRLWSWAQRQRQQQQRKKERNTALDRIPSRISLECECVHAFMARNKVNSRVRAWSAFIEFKSFANRKSLNWMLSISFFYRSKYRWFGWCYLFSSTLNKWLYIIFFSRRCAVFNGKM